MYKTKTLIISKKFMQFAIDKYYDNIQIILVVDFLKSTILAVIIPKIKIAMTTSLSKREIKHVQSVP
jgi:hypothetical protein